MISRKTTNPETPDVLERFDPLDRALRESHDSIPFALMTERVLAAQIGTAEIAGKDANGLRAKLADVAVRREADARKRGAAADAILGLEGELRAAREDLDRRRQGMAAEITREFLARHDTALHALQVLQAEGTALAHILGIPVPMQIPAKITTGWHDGVTRMEPAPPPGATVTLPPDLRALLEECAKVDGAISRCAGIRAGKETDQRFFRIAQGRGQGTEFRGVYRVAREFSCHLDGMPFPVGVLVDASLIGIGMLARLNTSRSIRPVEVGAAEAAA
jgi:hypothetical protein